MKKALFLRILFCIAFLGVLLYSYISKQNILTELRLEIPNLASDLQAVQDENTKLQFEIDRFENPLHLMELSRRPEFSHLRHPLMNEIITIPTDQNH